MAIDARFEKALRSSDRVGELRRFAQDLLAQGSAPDALCNQFEQVRQELRTANREDDEDAVLDVMDFLMGWCSPHMRLGDMPVREEGGWLLAAASRGAVESVGDHLRGRIVLVDVQETNGHAKNGRLEGVLGERLKQAPGCGTITAAEEKEFVSGR